MAFLPKKKKKILMVVDSKTDLESAEFLFQDKYIFLPTRSGKEAFNYLLRNTGVDLILLDLTIPGPDRTETIVRIKDIGLISNVPVVFLISARKADEQNHGIEKDTVDFLYKPYTGKELSSRVKSILKNPFRKKKPGNRIQRAVNY